MNTSSSRFIVRSTAAAALASITWSLMAVAADAPPNPPPGKGGRAAFQACRPDAERFCADVEKGGGRKIMCLRDHASQLSPACKNAFAEMAEDPKGARPK